MKTLLALSLMISVAAAASAKPGELHISISLTVSSHSKDSSSTHTNIVVTGDRLTYDETYSGFRASSRQAVHHDYRLTRPEVSNIERLISERNLLKSRSFTSVGESGPKTIYELTEDITWRGKTAQIKVFAPIHELSGDQATNNHVYQDADALLEYLRTVVNLKGENR